MKTTLKAKQSILDYEAKQAPDQSPLRSKLQSGPSYLHMYSLYYSLSSNGS